MALRPPRASSRSLVGRSPGPLVGGPASAWRSASAALRRRGRDGRRRGRLAGLEGGRTQHEVDDDCCRRFVGALAMTTPPVWALALWLALSALMGPSLGRLLRRRGGKQTAMRWYHDRAYLLVVLVCVIGLGAATKAEASDATCSSACARTHPATGEALAVDPRCSSGPPVPTYLGGGVFPWATAE